MWFIAAISVTIMSASAISSERINQTLDVLLTTPLTGREIVKQKMRAVRRMMLVMMVPLLTFLIAETRCYSRGYSGSYSFGYSNSENFWRFSVIGLLCLLIFLPMLAWFGFWMSLKLKNRLQAVLMSLGMIVFWNVGPLIIVAVVSLFSRGSPGAFFMHLIYWSPAALVVCNELNEFPHEVGATGAACVCFIINGAMLIIFRTKCLRNADRLLGRMRGSEDIRVPSAVATDKKRNLAVRENAAE
jgi:hypothetical protein